MKSTSIVIIASVFVGLAWGDIRGGVYCLYLLEDSAISGPAREEFAIVGVMERDVRVEVTGCVLDYTWCFLTVDGIPGWAFARSLVVDTEEGIIHVSDAADKGMVPIVGADGILVIKE